MKPLDIQQKWIRVIIVLLMSIVCGIAYYQGLYGKYFADDFDFIFIPYKHNIFHVFVDKNLTSYAYRPLEKLFLLLIQLHNGYDTLTIHICQLILHVVLCLGVFKSLQTLKYSLKVNTIVFAYLLLTQAATHSVASNDTFSQIISTIFGYGSLWCYLCFLRYTARRTRILFYFVTFVLFSLSIMGKETGLSFFLLIFFITIVNLKMNYISLRYYFLKIMTLIPFGLLIIAYLLLRNYIGLDRAEFGSNGTNMHLGLNVFINVIQSIVQILLPLSSVDLYEAIKSKNILIIIAALIFISILALIILYPLSSKSKRRMHLIIICMFPLSLFPVIILNHISELYVYNTLPIFAVALANSLQCIEEKYRNFFNNAVTGVFILIIVLNFMSVRKKCQTIYTNGEKTWTLINKITPLISEIPINGTLYLLCPDKELHSDYSIFKRSGLRLFEDGETIFNQITKRDNFNVKCINDLRSVDLGTKNSLIITLDSNNKIQQIIKD